MRTIIFGGHGKVALLLSRMLADEEHRVTSVIRNPDHADEVTAAGATPVVVDLEYATPTELAEVMRGHDVVVWSAGAGGGSAERTRAVDRDAAIRSMDAAIEAGVGRYVMVSYFGAGVDHGVPADHSFHAYAEAKAAADAHLRGTELAWTILGPSSLTLVPGTGRIETGEHLTGTSVPREDVARVAAAVLVRPDTAGCVIDFNTGDTVIDAALDDVVRRRT